MAGAAENLEPVRSIDDLMLQDVHAREQRLVHEYDIPKVLSDECGYRMVGVVSLSADEELMATRRAAGDQVRLAFELAKEALRFVDDQKVSTADGTVDRIWIKPDFSKVRTLVVTAYNETNQPTQESTQAFLKSRRVRAG
jgi:hypothetical protein